MLRRAAPDGPSRGLLVLWLREVDPGADCRGGVPHPDGIGLIAEDTFVDGFDEFVRCPIERTGHSAVFDHERCWYLTGEPRLRRTTSDALASDDLESDPRNSGVRPQRVDMHFFGAIRTPSTRECNKPPGIGDVLEAHRPQFDQLHARCGLAIHAGAERAGAAESILPAREFELIARNILESEGHTKSDRDALIEQMMRLAQQRLVLLVPRMDGLAFEVRSVAEFFAARCLMAGEDAADKLELLVPWAHWRHTWLRGAGYIFSERLYLRDAVVSRLRTADHSNAVNRLVMPGAALAIDALRDGFAANTQRFEQDLVVSALRLLTGPIGSHITELADALVPLMERSAGISDAVWREIEALLADQSPGATRAFLTSLAATDSDAIAVRATNRLAAYVEQGGAAVAAAGDDDASTMESIRAQLITAALIAHDESDPRLFETIARKSTDGNEDYGPLFEAREILVEGCGCNLVRRSKIRAYLADVPRVRRCRRTWFQATGWVDWCSSSNSIGVRIPRAE